MHSFPTDIRPIEELLSYVFPNAPTQIEQVEEGMSTYVYRLKYRQEIFYLRILPEEGASFAPEVAVHTRLRQMQLHLPEVIYFDHYHPTLQRSIMITTEIKGQPLSRSSTLNRRDMNKILRDAGRELAHINSINVDGFGWVERDRADATRLQAEWCSLRAFILEHWHDDLAYLARSTLPPRTIAALERLLSQHSSWLDIEQGYLAHGDLDTTHIYQHNGQYSGIIDFGEIRGASRWYDLAHFHMRDGEELPYHLLPELICGYGEVIQLPADYEQHIRFTSILINVRALVRSLQKRPPNKYTQHQVKVLQEDLATL